MIAIVLLADLKESRKKEGRDAVGQRIREGLGTVSRRFEDHLVTAFDVQRGIDEFGGVIETDAPSGEVLLELWKTLHPHEVRFSLARGSLDVVPQTSNPSVHEFDGPALHAAAEALDAMDREGKLVSLTLEDRETDPVLEDLANLLYFQVLDWTSHQLEVYEAYRREGSQAEVADHFGISQPTVSEILGNVRSRFVAGAFEHFTERISETLGGPA